MARRRRRPPKGPRSPRNYKSLMLKVLIGMACLMGALLIGTGIALVVVFQRLPDVRQLENYTPPQATEIMTENGQLLTRINAGGRYDPVSLDDIPKYVQDAVISAEDRRFWQHQGVDIFGLARAVISNIRNPNRMQGASTLTQQMIKNLFLTPERTASRKISEALLAVQLERYYSKKQILELYLNHVFLGHNVYGVQAAAQIYFGKTARQLTVAEAALLAGIIRSPEYFSPYHNPESARKLMTIVLNQMEEDNLLSPEAKEQAMNQQIRLVGLRTSYPYPYFLDYVMYSLRKDYGDIPFKQGGWKIYTTINPQLQATAERLLQQHAPRLSRSRAQQAALVSMDTRTGYVRSMVGGMSYASSQFNRAFQAKRQVGSTFKPFVYLTAFEKGMNLGDTVVDSAVNYGGYRPRNYDRRYHGTVTLQQALASSLNIPTVKIADKVGMGLVAATAHRAGVESSIPEDLSSALGASEMTLLELTAAYASFANGGFVVKPTAITRVLDQEGNLIDDFVPSETRVFDSNPINKLNTALQSVISSGTGRAAQIGRPAAGKTGTTDGAQDTWFVGYVPQLVTGVWAGNDNPSPTLGGGGTTCAPIWHDYMLIATRQLQPLGFNRAQDTKSELEEPSPSPSESASVEASAVPTPEATAAGNQVIEIPVEETKPAPIPSDMVMPTEPPISETPLPLDVPPDDPLAVPTVEPLEMLTPEPPVN